MYTAYLDQGLSAWVRLDSGDCVDSISQAVFWAERVFGDKWIVVTDRGKGEVASRKGLLGLKESPIMYLLKMNWFHWLVSMAILFMIWMVLSP